MDELLAAREKRRDAELHRWIEEGSPSHVETVAAGKEADGGEASTHPQPIIDAFDIDDDAFDDALETLFEAGTPSPKAVRELVRRFKDKASNKPMRFTFEDRPTVIRKRTFEEDQDSISSHHTTTRAPEHRPKSRVVGDGNSKESAPSSTTMLPVLTASGWILAPRISVAPDLYAPDVSKLPLGGPFPVPPPPTKALPKWSAAKAAIENALSLVSVPREDASARSGLMAPSAKATRHTIATLDIYTELRVLQKKDILELVTSIDRVLAGYFSSEIWDAVAKLAPLHMVVFDAESGSKLTRRMVVDEGSLSWTEEVVDESKAVPGLC
ncbi:hypothetical protein BC829DRAFT_422023 [Chytridium lagenaria]|nr:hypothetical protein BC829DRAFT_422023 [Chytridium lagenaria]